MPLLQSALSSSLESFFSDPPETAAACARKWADAMRDYTLPIVPPSTTVTIAAETLAATLTPIFQTSLSAATTAAAMEAAWAVYAVSVGAGMAPGYVATPPPGIVGFSGLFGVRPMTHHEAAESFSLSIHIWMATGLAVPVPAGPSVPWS